MASNPDDTTAGAAEPAVLESEAGAEAASAPLSPIRPTAPPSLAHNTPVPQKSYIDMDTRAINDAPVELDGSAILDTGSGATSSGAEVKEHAGKEDGLVGLGDQEDEFLLENGEMGVGRALREKRKSLLRARQRDPSVIVDVPSEPTAEEVEAAKSAEGMVTPGLGGKEFAASATETRPGV